MKLSSDAEIGDIEKVSPVCLLMLLKVGSILFQGMTDRHLCVGAFEERQNGMACRSSTGGWGQAQRKGGNRRIDFERVCGLLGPLVSSFFSTVNCVCGAMLTAVLHGTVSIHSKVATPRDKYRPRGAACVMHAQNGGGATRDPPQQALDCLDPRFVPATVWQATHRTALHPPPIFRYRPPYLVSAFTQQSKVPLDLDLDVALDSSFLLAILFGDPHKSLNGLRRTN